MNNKTKIKMAIQMVTLLSMTNIGFASFYAGILRQLNVPLTGMTLAVVLIVLALLSTGALFTSIWRN